MKDWQLVWFDGKTLIAADANKTLPIAQVKGGSAGIGLGSVVGRLYAQVTETFNNLTSVRVLVKLREASTGGTLDRTIMDSSATLRASLTPGKVLLNEVFPAIPEMDEASHVRVEIDVTGTAPTTGKIFVGYSLESEGIREQAAGTQLGGAGSWKSQYTEGFEERGTTP